MRENVYIYPGTDVKYPRHRLYGWSILLWLRTLKANYTQICLKIYHNDNTNRFSYLILLLPTHGRYWECMTLVDWVICHKDIKVWRFENLTLRIPVKGHWWDKFSRSYNWSNNQSAHMHPVHSKSIGAPISGIRIFQNLTLNFQGQGHSWRSHSVSNILSTRIPLTLC